jgi:ribosomal protein S18 acetylase RimI-like enzyme
VIRGADVGIRPAQVGDATAIASLHADNWRRHYRGAYSDRYLDGDLDTDRLTVWTERLRRPDAGRLTLVAVDGDTVVGFTCLVLDADPTWGILADNLHVDSAARRTGVGTRLLAAAARIAMDERPGSGIYLWVLERNEPAQAFYRERNATFGDQGPVVAPKGDPLNLDGTPVRVRMYWSDPAILIPS